jgi:hypothetical protein
MASLNIEFTEAMTASVWIVSDGAAGNERQAEALANRLGDVRHVLRVRPRWPWRWLAPRFAPTLNERRWLRPWPRPFPDIAVGAGRFGAAALLSIARAHPTTKTVQILDPRINPARFDAVTTPLHDALVGGNVVSTVGSLHAIDDAWLKRERIAHAPLSRLAAPRTVVLLGGPRRGVDIGRATLARLAETLARWRDTGSVALIASRRTPRAWLDALADAPADVRWAGPNDGPNPYRGALAWADRIIVSADSVNMQSEALATGKPVFSLCDGVPRGKLGRFHRELVESGRLRPLRSEPAIWAYPPLRELEAAALRIRQLLDL